MLEKSDKEKDYDVKIGLEIHMHLNTKEKLFCSCKVPKKNDPVNSHICPICTGQPGSKPMLPNKEALKCVLKLGLIFNSELTRKTNFQRKHYTWPDMPTGYQRTVSGGKIKETCIGGSFNGIRIAEIHLEENPAGWDPVTGELNYNRSGFPLAEIVTEPDFHSTEQLKEWLEKLILFSKHLGIYNEDFGIKSDVNVSIKEGNFQRVELKNVNSLTNIVKAAETEIKRQKEEVKKGNTIKQETRRYDETTDSTQFMRSKESAQDYMFIPDPDLPNIIVDDKLIEECKSEIPELPDKIYERISKYNLDEETKEVIISHPYLTNLFNLSLSNNLDPKKSALFIRREIMRVINYHYDTVENFSKKNLDDEILTLLKLIINEDISYQTGQRIIEKLYDEKFDVKKYVQENNLIQVKDTDTIEKLIRDALDKAPKAVEDFKNGNEKALNFIVGIVMRETKGTAKPQLVNELMKKIIKEY